MDRLPLAVQAAVRAAMCVAVPFAVILGACGGEDVDSAEDYCELVDGHLAELTTPTIEDAGDVDVTVGLYRQLADAAPLAIEPEWRVMVASMEAAAAADPADPPSVQAATDAARESQVSANAVIAYTQQQCGLTLGLPGNTTVPPPPETTPAT
jgi:hypothetical protein